LGGPCGALRAAPPIRTHGIQTIYLSDITCPGRGLPPLLLTRRWILSNTQAKVDQSKSKKQDLLSSGWDYVHVQIGLSKIPQRVKVKPIPIRLPHPLYSADDDFAMCLIVKVRLYTCTPMHTHRRHAPASSHSIPGPALLRVPCCWRFICHA
jgi:hypothetical protein